MKQISFCAFKSSFCHLLMVYCRRDVREADRSLPVIPSVIGNNSQVRIRKGRYTTPCCSFFLLLSPQTVCPTLWSFRNLSLTNSPKTTMMCCFNGQKGQMPGSLILQAESHHAIRTKHRSQWQLLSTNYST